MTKIPTCPYCGERLHCGCSTADNGVSCIDTAFCFDCEKNIPLMTIVFIEQSADQHDKII